MHRGKIEIEFGTVVCYPDVSAEDSFSRKLLWQKVC